MLTSLVRIHRLQQEKQKLEDERLKRFCSAMKAVNGRLGSIYQKLTAGQGDAYLSFTEDALLLFAEGVHFHVRCGAADGHLTCDLEKACIVHSWLMPLAAPSASVSNNGVRRSVTVLVPAYLFCWQ